MGHPARAGELAPCVGPVGGPVPADWFWLGGLDQAGCEPGSALGDAGPGEGGCFFPRAVVEDRLDWSRDGWQAAGEFLPGAGVEAPSLHGLAAVLVVDEAGC